MERTATPELLPIFRSRQQAEILADLLDNPDREQSLTDLARRLNVPIASAHREVERAERAGLIASRRVGNVRLLTADTNSPYFRPLRELLVMAFGAPARLAAALAEVPAIEAAYIFGSWAARWHGQPGVRPVNDIDVLILGEPDRDQLYQATSDLEQALGREVQLTVRPAGWIKKGTGTFHDTVASRPMLQIIGHAPQSKKSDAAATARSAS